MALSAWLSIACFVLSDAIVCVDCLAAAGSRRNKKNTGSKNTSTRGFGKPAKVVQQQHTYTPDTSERIQTLLKLLEEQECEGLEATEIGLDDETGLRGVFCKEDIAAGEYICAIPFVSTLLVDETLQAERSLSASRVENSINFLEEFADMKEWKPYLDCLPQLDDVNFDATPDFWTRDEICQLEIPTLVNVILARKEILKELADEHNVDLRKLQHAAWIIQTRAFTTFQKVPDSELVRSRTVLIPYLDFLNHSPTQANAELQVVETKAYDESFYALMATRPIPAGKQIQICYGTGKETSLDLFAKYGFFLPNPNDEQYLPTLETSFTKSLEQDKQALENATDGSVHQRILQIRTHVKQLKSQ